MCAARRRATATARPRVGKDCNKGCSKCSPPTTAPIATRTRRASCAPKGKQSFRYVPNGIPGIATRMPILFSEGVVKGRIDLNRFVALTSTNHAKRYGLYPQKGTITVGSDADLVLWDAGREVTITHSLLQDGCDYTPYEGLAVTGWPVRTMLRGETVMADGQIATAKPGRELLRAR